MTTETQNVAAPAPAPAAAAPSPAPAPAPVDQVAIGAPAPAPAESTAISYEPTNDPGLDMALDFLGKLGIGPEDAAMAAAMNGDFAMLKGKLSGLGDKAKGWEKYVALGEKAAKESSEKATAKVAADKALIHSAVGGEENWKAISEWAGKNAEPAEKDAVNAALKQGGLVAKVMAQWLSAQHAKASGTVKTPANVAAPGAAGKADVAGPLTAADYSKEVQALRSKLGYQMESSQAYRTLQARRTAGRASGI